MAGKGAIPRLECIDYFGLFFSRKYESHNLKIIPFNPRITTYCIIGNSHRPKKPLIFLESVQNTVYSDALIEIRVLWHVIKSCYAK